MAFNEKPNERKGGLKVETKLKLLGVVLADVTLELDYSERDPDGWQITDVEIFDPVSEDLVSLPKAARGDRRTARENNATCYTVINLLDDAEIARINEKVWEEVKS